MLFANPMTAIAEMHRVVKPEAKVAVMVWSTVDRNPFHGLPLEIVRRIGNFPAPAHSQPGMFALGDIGLLTDMYQKVGELRSKRVEIENRWRTLS